MACLDLLREREVSCLAGSYDAALVGGDAAPPFNGRARQRLEWARGQLRPSLLSGRGARERWRWFTGLSEQHERRGLLAVHGHPGSPLWGHMPIGFEDDAPPNAGLVGSFFEGVDGLVACGVLGRPSGVSAEGHFHGRLGDPAPPPLARVGTQAICPGSVGQPRDRDARACYAIVFEDRVEWRRVDYDLDPTCAKLVASGLPADDPLVRRLREGI
ncbi:MAG: hypothetical protein AB7N76_27065 [Planctomycetota bacterium]